MADKKQLTPEKRLLELIEKPETKEVRRTEVAHKTRRFFSWGAFKGRFSFFREKAKDGLSIKRKPSLTIRDINKILKICIAGLIVYLSWSSMKDYDALNEEVALDITKVPAIDKGEIESPLSLKKKSYYQEQVRKRNMFSFIPEKKPEVPVAKENEKEEKKEVTPKIVELTKNLALVGISWSNNPEAMIEDREAKRTLFLKRGDIINNVRVQAIFKDKVILNYEGQELELR